MPYGVILGCNTPWSSLQLRSYPSLWCDHTCTRESNSTYLLVSGSWSIFRTWPTEAQVQETSCGTYQKGDMVNMVPWTDHRALVPERDFQIYPYAVRLWTSHRLVVPSVSTMSVCPGYFCLVLSNRAFKNPRLGVTGLKPTDAIPTFLRGSHQRSGGQRKSTGKRTADVQVSDASDCQASPLGMHTLYLALHATYPTNLTEPNTEVLRGRGQVCRQKVLGTTLATLWAHSRCHLLR